MKAAFARVSTRTVAVIAVVVLLAATFFVFQGGAQTRTVTAYFDRTVSIYKGSELRVMGVRIGTVTAVVPEGDRVRVAMEYDEEYKLPADGKAAIITPTLTADRFVQIAPAYSGGPVMKDKARIDLAETGTPVELDRIYQSLSDVTTALGPNGANRNGSLDDLLSAGTKALQGNGKLGNQTLLNLSAAVQTFGEGSGPLFDSVENMSKLTETLAANDRVVDGFMTDLTSVSAQLSGERDELRGALAALARAVGIVRTFVKDNKNLVEKDVRQLTDVVGVLAKQKDSLNTAARLSGLGLQNLTLAFDHKSGSVGSRLQIAPTGAALGPILCGVVRNAGITDSDFVCELLKTIVAPVTKEINNNPAEFKPPQLQLGGTAPVTTLPGLLNSLKEGNR